MICVFVSGSPTSLRNTLLRLSQPPRNFRLAGGFAAILRTSCLRVEMAFEFQNCSPKVNSEISRHSTMQENYAAATIAMIAVLTMICRTESLNFSIRMVPALAFRRSEEHTSELQSRQYLVCRLLLEK